MFAPKSAHPKLGDRELTQERVIMSTTVRRLIKKAAHIAGTERAIAQRLKVTPQRLSEWKGGHRPMPDQQVIALAELAAANPQVELGRYRWERYHGDPKATRRSRTHSNPSGVVSGASKLIASARGALTPSALRAALHALRRLGTDAPDADLQRELYEEFVAE